MMIIPAAPAEPPSASAGRSVGPASQELVDAANAFEAIFLRQMLSAMRQSKLGDDLFGGPATEQFQTMQYDAVADTMAKNGSFGIAEMLLARFSRGSNGVSP